MDREQAKLDELLELSQLINKTVFFEGELYKIIKVNTVYIYGNNYVLDNELSINNNVVFLFVLLFDCSMALEEQFLNSIS